MRRDADQPTMFDVGHSLPNGFVYHPDFLTREEEAQLIGYLEDLPLEWSTSNGYKAKRRHLNFGWSFDFKNERLIPGPLLPPFLRPLQRKVAKWLDIPTWRVAEALVTEYPKGAAIGWHRDNESFESIVGISLSSWCYLRLRPLSVRMVRRRHDVITLPVERRSAYLMQRKSRWCYQHSIPCVENLRYSITLRTLPHSITKPTKTK